MKVISDTLPLVMCLNDHQINVAKKKSIPLFRGILSKVVDDFGNEVPISENTVVLGGALLALEKIFGETASYIPDIVTVDTAVAPSTTNAKAASSTELTSCVRLFGVGVGGSTLEFGNVIDPDFKQRNVIDMIPLRVTTTPDGQGYNNTAEDDPFTDDEAGKYYFRQQLAGGLYGWFLKEFDEVEDSNGASKYVNIATRIRNSASATSDGELITTDSQVDSSSSYLEAYGECRFTISSKDIKEYFTKVDPTSDNIGVNKARYNTIGLFSGIKESKADSLLGGKARAEYSNVRLFSVVTFDNISVKEDKSDTYVYRVYGAI